MVFNVIFFLESFMTLKFFSCILSFGMLSIFEFFPLLFEFGGKLGVQMSSFSIAHIFQFFAFAL